MTDGGDRRAMPEDSEPAVDPRLDAAWRAHAREAPPATVDAAILAAAHREGGAGPTASATEAATGAAPGARPRSPASWSWRWPLAAAAAVTAIVVGVLRLVPEERTDTQIVAMDARAPSTPEPASPASPSAHSEAAASTAAAPSEPAATPALASAERARSPSRGSPTPPTGEADAVRRSAPAISSGAPSAPASRLPALADLSSAVPVRPEAAGAAAPAALTPEEWIERIRRLRDAKRQEEAARELKAFRNAWPDADRRLPPEWHDWAATVPR